MIYTLRSCRALGSSLANVRSASPPRERGSADLRATLNTATFKKNLQTFLFRESYSTF